MENGKLILRGISIHLNIDELEISLNDLHNLENKIINSVVKENIPIIFPLYYNATDTTIQKDDTVRILPSENCVSNTDTLKYDERIDGCLGSIVNIFPNDNKVSVKIFINGKWQTVVVHSHWIEKTE